MAKNKNRHQITTNIIKPTILSALVPIEVIVALRDEKCLADVLMNITTDQDCQLLISDEELCRVVEEDGYFPVSEFPNEYKILKNLYEKYADSKIEWFWLDVR